jgi:predicted RNA binding protein YcfA (HicA-like mRNA interferase family)
LAGKEAAAAFEKLGWSYWRRRSSHMIYKKAGVFAALTIPDEKSLSTGTLRSLIRDAQVTVEDFIAALK